ADCSSSHMRVADIITASFLMVFGGIVLVDAVRLGFRWGTDGPQSGFFPFWLAIILLSACGAIVVQAARRRSDHTPFVNREQLVPVLKVLLPATAMVLLIHFLGLYVSSALYLAFYMRWAGRHSWVSSLTVAVAVPLITFLVFEKWFLVPLPKGP